METKEIKTVLIDGYLDEPSCLGVPPFISPHIRYTYGALLGAGIAKEKISYQTIDQLRENWETKLSSLENFDLVIIIAGTTVPGHYLGGKPISLTEIKELSQKLYYPNKILGGPITLIKKDLADFDHICQELAAFDIYQLLTGKKIDLNSDNITGYIDEWALLGAEVTTLHPNYPNLMIEIETFRGCPRVKHCAFCSERLKKKRYQRSPDKIVQEVKALAEAGNHFFRLGCQTDILLFQSENRPGGNFIPNPEAIDRLYQGIRKADPDLKVLHLDNMNPATIVKHETASREILKTITKYNTPGDIAAFGLESADPQVISRNNIDTDPEMTYQAVEILNEIGGRREKGIPRLLPGLNLLHGLLGEREETLDYNYQYLKRLLEAGLMLRRINIRQVVTLDKYPTIKVDHRKFISYKERVNEEINRPMLQRVFPLGTVIEGVLIEKHKGNLSYGRQLGSYPILIGIPGRLDLGQFITVRVLDYGYRSLTALPWPFRVNEASSEQLAAFPGIGKKRARKIFLARPNNLAELKTALEDDLIFARWEDWFHF